MRLFLSCDIPQEIAEYVHTLAGQLPDAKLTVPKNIDLTIKFLGEVPDAKLDDIKKRLSQIKFAPFRAMLNGIGAFNEDVLRVVWAGVTPSEKFEELHALVDSALKGMFPEEKKFQAHLTIARVKFVDDKEKFLAAVKKVKVEPKTFSIDKLVLFSSTLDAKGATHERVLEIKAQ